VRHAVPRWVGIFLLAGALVWAVALLLQPSAPGASSGSSRPLIPRTWDDGEMEAFELPLVDSSVTRTHITSDYYYRLPERIIYRNYPVYAANREPPGYLERLRTLESEVAFDASQLTSEGDWLRAGEIVFDAPKDYDGAFTSDRIRDPQLLARVGVPIAADGTVPFFRYVVRRRGVIELGFSSCGTCHTRVMPDGSIIKGAQGNFPFDRLAAESLFRSVPLPTIRSVNRMLFAAPWVRDDPGVRLDAMTREELVAAFAALPPGVLARQGTSVFHPPRIPDLIGVEERQYLDSTGLNRHHGIADLMRYAALNQTLDVLTRYNDFIPAASDFRTLPAPGTSPFPGSADRYSDAQLYALARYIYSLRPPPSPHPVDAAAKRGQQVFQDSGCGTCHTPPLYTNNRITPAAGFSVPPEHLRRYDVLPISVGTDPTLALTTRRGTGYYKVPSLKGLWYRGPLEHNGSVATLEDWFNPARLRDDYTPTGFIGHDRKVRPVRGHEFGLDLPDADKKALIAFLRTL
jgi:hypothetical protein